ncbi:MAG TPA: hypothetical protein VLE21_02645, partial [Candidatus Nitrosocosmicus sp.]|nr:hypothetical protein [Candidatus Nitrosocosmicus sp.]
RIDSRLEGMTGYPKFKNKASKIPTKKGATDLQRGRVGVGGASDTVSAVSMPAPVPKSASELQSASENKRSHRSLIPQLKSSIINIRLGKFGEDKNKGNSAKTSDSIESAPKLDEKNTTNAIASTIDEDTNEIHRTLSKIEPNLEPISQDMRSSDSDKTEKVNIDTNEIDKIQSDILKTLKRLEDS